MKNNCNIKDIYNSLYFSQDIIDIYIKTEECEDESKLWAYHNFAHIENVTKTTSEILTKLDFDEELIYKAKIACLLHDVGAINGKENHAYRSYVFAKEYFEKNNIDFKDIDLVLEAIKIHSDGFDTNNIIALALIFADKLDMKNSRISKEGRNIIGNREFCHIEDINVDIENKLLKINIVTDGNINLKEINEYYFTPKIFKAIETFANKMDLKHLVLMDNEEWKI